MEKEIIETLNTKIWLEEGIVHLVILPKAEITFEDIKKELEIAFKLTKGKKSPFLVDSREIKFINREARKTISSKECEKVVSALALLVGSPLSRMLGNFIMGINKPPFSAKLFTDEEEAIKWLKKYIE